MTVTWHLNRAEVQLWRICSLSDWEMCSRVSRKYFGRNMKCGSPQLHSRSPFREMEWKNSVDSAILYLSVNLGLGFLLLILRLLFSFHFPVCYGCTRICAKPGLVWFMVTQTEKENQTDCLHVFYIYSQHKWKVSSSSTSCFLLLCFFFHPIQ